MKTFQILGICAVFSALYIARNYSQFKIRIYTKLFFLLIAILGIFLFLFPNYSTFLAQTVGVGRGADLVFYCSSLGLFLIVAALIAKFREIEIFQAKLVREIALSKVIFGEME